MGGWRWLAGVAVVGSMAGSPAGAVPLLVAVSGQVGAPATFDAASLAKLPQATQTETYRGAGRLVTDTFTGPTLAAVLDAAGGIVSNPALHNGLLRQYVVATGADGYSAVVSAGEIAARFGHRPDLVATGDTLNQLPAPDGFARLVASGDVAGGRYVSNLTSLDVRTAPPRPGTGGGVSTAVTVDGAVTAPLRFDLSALRAFTPHTTTVSYLSGPASVTDTYTGALLWDVLNAAGIVTDPAYKNDLLRRLVTATGTDGYQVDFSLGELSPSFGDEPVLVAYDDTAGQFAAGGGVARLVVPGDVAGGRYVSNLVELSLFDGVSVPEPTSIAVLSLALAAMGLGRRRRSPMG